MKKRLLTAVAVILTAGCATGPDGVKPAPLLETRWYAVELEGQPAKAESAKAEAHLVLSSERNNVSGFSGCNTFRGIYERNDNELRFMGLAATRMACGPAADGLEKRFLSAAQASDTQHISGNTLELRDVNGKTRARFEARSAPR
jgi:heat shock protein HslJ